MKLILGLDLGITSVGYGIIEADTYKVINYGVRMFDERDASENLKRREFRSSRRIKSRKRNRINAIKYLLLNNKIIDSINFPVLNNVYELRVKGLTNKLTNIELANVLVNIAKRRGSSLEIAIDEDSEDQALASALTNNTNYLIKNNKFICEYQYEKIKNGEKLRGHDNLFRTIDYENELKQILSNQGLSKEINDKIIDIVTRRRAYSEGPGSYEFPTPYGSYREEYVDGELKISHVNLIEEMRGKCSIFKDEPRIAKNTYTACLFNLLNDLNNITIDGSEKISTEQKNIIINDYINEKGKITVNQLCKLLNKDIDQLSGFRLKNGKPLLTTFDGYSKLLNILPNTKLLNKNNVDNIIEILTKTAVVEERKNLLSNMDLDLTSDEIEKIAVITKINGYHSLSKKAMNIIIPEMIDTDKNQMQIINDNNLNRQQTIYSGSKIPFDDEAILSAVTKRVHIQALKVVNELRKQYGEFDSIVIETTRAKNSQDEKKMIADEQKRFLENKEKTEKLLLELEKNPDDINLMTKLKLVLYKQQNGKTIYAGLPIDLDRLLNDPTAYQIEHILPYAISFDNSLNNKALASSRENQEKGRKTPWEYFSSGKVSKLNGSIKTWEDFETVVNNLQINKKKKENLLNQKDISKFINMEEFVSRNLNDTSYGIRTVMNSMKKYFSDNNIETKVFTVKGKFTHDFRSRIGLKKDRDFYIHHAIDALIIAGSKNQKVFSNAYKLFTDTDGITQIAETGEIFDFTQDPFEDNRFLNFISSLKMIKGEPRDFSWKVDKKTNRSFADQTIYSTRKINGEDFVVKKYKDIYGKDGESIKKLFDTGEASNKLLMAKNDEKTYELIEKIYKSYKNEKNPFLKYREEFGPIRKYSKNGDGPIINQIKYYDAKLNSHLDISHKYNVKDKKVILLQNSPYRTDIYISPDGKYKMVTIRRYHLKQVNGMNEIEADLYNDLKETKKITPNDEFLFSLNRYDIINFVSKKDLLENVELESIKNYYRFIATNNDTKNIIEIKEIYKKTEKQTMVTLGSAILLEKFNVSVTGKWSKVVKEDLKLKW